MLTLSWIIRGSVLTMCHRDELTEVYGWLPRFLFTVALGRSGGLPSIFLGLSVPEHRVLSPERSVAVRRSCPIVCLEGTWMASMCLCFHTCVRGTGIRGQWLMSPRAPYVHCFPCQPHFTSPSASASHASSRVSRLTGWGLPERRAVRVTRAWDLCSPSGCS